MVRTVLVTGRARSELCPETKPEEVGRPAPCAQLLLHDGIWKNGRAGEMRICDQDEGSPSRMGRGVCG